MMREFKFRIWHEYLNELIYFDIENVPDLELAHSIMQWTSMKDKNGKDIYEGDIMKYDGGVLSSQIVTFKYGKFMLGNSSLWDYVVKDCCIIIGNIHEMDKNGKN